MGWIPGLHQNDKGEKREIEIVTSLSRLAMTGVGGGKGSSGFRIKYGMRMMGMIFCLPHPPAPSPDKVAQERGYIYF